MQKTKISYLTHTWNPIAMRCTPVSEGCENCWHLAMCKRKAKNPILPAEVQAASAGGTPVLLAEELGAPYRLRNPARIGVQFMGDLFQEQVPLTIVHRIWDTMWIAHQHTFLVLTKRPKRMQEFVGQPNSKACFGGEWPLPNLWLGVSVENQRRADERIPRLWNIASAVRFVSFEPLLTGISCGNLNLVQRVTPGLDWIIIGCESGPRRRPCKLDWVRSLVDQVNAAGVPVFVKQLEINGKVTSDPADWPEWARRQEFPKQES